MRFLATTLEEAGFRVATLHGERSQPEREVRCWQTGFPWSETATDSAARVVHPLHHLDMLRCRRGFCAQCCG